MYVIRYDFGRFNEKNDVFNNNKSRKKADMK